MVVVVVELWSRLMPWLLSLVFGWWLGGFVAGFGGLVVRFLMWWDQVGGSRWDLAAYFDNVELYDNVRQHDRRNFAFKFMMRTITSNFSAVKLKFCPLLHKFSDDPDFWLENRTREAFEREKDLTVRHRLVNFGVVDSLAFEFGFWLVARGGWLLGLGGWWLDLVRFSIWWA